MNHPVASPASSAQGSQRRARSGRREGRDATVGADSVEGTPEPETRLVHRCLGKGEPGSVPVESFAGSDRDRVGLVLQACCLISHLQRARLRPLADLSEARVDSFGRLRVGEVEAGVQVEAPQQPLRRLLRALFQGVGLAGRGQGRRAARSLNGHWQQDLVPVSPQAEVARVLDEASFLWDRACSVHREALVGVHEDGPWVAGPSSFRRRVLAAVTPEGLEDLLRGEGALELWRGSVRGDGPSLFAEHRWADAVRAWSLRPPEDARERLDLARSLLALGRFEAALAELKGSSSTAARVLRLQCQLQLGRLQAARRSVGHLSRLDLAPAELVEVAEVALRVYANLRDPQGARDWIARAKSIRRGRAAVAGRVVAAFGQWDLNDVESMDRELASARELAGDRPLPWSYHQAHGLHAARRGDGPEAVASLETALRADRRALRRYEAGRLWTDLVLARVANDDLEGAERACRHAARLLAGCEGPARDTLALCNLAEIRVRRGRLAGVETIIERSMTVNRRSHNVRGFACDVEVQARLELARGRPDRALACCRELLEGELEIHNREELELFSVRALGWLGRPEGAARLLARLPEDTLAQLEPEERPALYALAGDEERALEVAQGSSGKVPVAELWRSVVDDRVLPERLWASLEGLGSYRLARLVFDVELVSPGATARRRRAWAAHVLRSVGAKPLAERLESLDGGAWAALDSFLATPDLEPGRLRALFVRAGLPAARLERRRHPLPDWEVVFEGPGGDVETEHVERRDEWRLTHRREDPAASAILRAVALAAAEDGVREADGIRTRPSGDGNGGMVGSSPALREAIRRLRRLGSKQVPVVIQGETGTGKELAARLLHRASPRAEGPFLAINCAALSDTLGMSDLFGHARGAFTGADRDRAGVFESARAGTVLLDEIGDLPLPAQGLLLRVLQEGEVRRLGESVPRPVDARIVAATHRDLGELVARGAFREDLLYRLRVGTVTLPPLRERGGDLERLTEHFLEAWPGTSISAEALERLRAQPWPGNVRQLKAVLDSAAALLDPPSEAVILARHLELPESGSAGLAPYHEWLEQLKKERIESELRRAGWNQSRAARRLGLTRQALSYLVKQLGPFGPPR